MGTPKALLEASAGVSFLRRLVETFSAAGLVSLVVTGAHAESIQHAHPDVATVFNEAWPSGQLGSVRVGLRAALLQGADRILVQPVDAPLISAATVAAVLSALAESPAAVPSWDDRPGHPLGLQRGGATAVLGSRATTLADAIGLIDARLVPVDDPAVLDNLNSPEAYALRFGHWPCGLPTTR